MKLISKVAMVTIYALTTANVYASIFDPAKIRVTDGFSLTPKVNTSIEYNDNIYTSEIDKISSEIYVINPSFTFGFDDGINRYGGEYELESGIYSYDSSDNYYDHNFNLYAHTEFTSRHRTDVKLGITNEHEERGAGLTETVSFLLAEPVKYNNYFADLYYQYGSKGAIINLGAGIRYDIRDYQNFTSSTQYDEYSQLTFITDGSYQIGQVTYLTTEWVATDISYKLKKPTSTDRNNLNNVVKLGLRWDGAKNIVGSAKLGYQYKNFDDSLREDFNGYIVLLGVKWSPVEYSNFQLQLNRNAEEAYTVGDYALVNSVSLDWSHDWNQKVTSKILISYENVDYEGADRMDDTISSSFNITYELTRWLKAYSGFEYTKKDSNASNVQYDKNIFTLGVTVSL